MRTVSAGSCAAMAAVLLLTRSHVGYHRTLLSLFNNPAHSSQAGRLASGGRKEITHTASTHSDPTHSASARCFPADYCRNLANLHHWRHFPITVAFERNPINTPARVQAMIAGIRQWVSADPRLISVEVIPDPARANITLSCDPHRDQSVTNTQYELRTQALSHADITIGIGDTDESSRICGLSDIQCLTAHEFGHALGIDGHSDDPDDLMYPSMDNNRAVTMRDLTTLLHAY